jgi:2-oxoglutarate ferredoxin oxidoreductase subunit beta
VDFNTLHTTHGRALTFATGVKLAKPILRVIVIMGDGDAVGIGGNHFIHTARRNIDLTAIIVNNSIYGMTGGQSSPTTPRGMKSTTTVYNNIENTFNISDLATTAGAAFVARGTVYHAKLLDELMEKAFLKQGFSVVEVISHCHTHYGKLNQMGTAVDMLEWQRDHAVTKEKAAAMNPGELADRFLIGVLTDRELPVYQTEQDNLRRQAHEVGN